MPERLNELWCHACERYVQFLLDDSLDGNHEIKCPNCGHIHYRHVKRGEVTDIRYRSSDPTWVCQVTGTSTYSYWSMSGTSSGSSSSSDYYLRSSWLTMAGTGSGST